MSYTRWSPATKKKAMQIARESSITEASEITHVPDSTISAWFQKEEKQGAAASTASQPTEPAAPDAIAVLTGTIPSGEMTPERLRAMVNNLYLLAEQAIGKMQEVFAGNEVIVDGSKVCMSERDRAAWVRAITGFLALALGKAEAVQEQVDEYDREIKEEWKEAWKKEAAAEMQRDARQFLADHPHMYEMLYEVDPNSLPPIRRKHSNAEQADEA